MDKDMNNIKILMTFRNCQDFLERSLTSVFAQDYKNFKILLVNDASEDNSDAICQKFIDQYPDQIIYTKNEDRKYALYNQQRAIFDYTNPEDIVVTVDGDDFFSGVDSLSYVNDFYTKENCLMTYGQYQRLNGNRGQPRPFQSEEEFNNLRSIPFFVSHLRTFKAKVFHEIKNQDPELTCMKDEHGNWYRIGCDMVFCLPLLEVAGYDKVKYIDKVLYIYNHHQHSDDRIHGAEQIKTDRECRTKNKFSRKEF